MTGEACDNTANAGEAKPFNATWEPRCPGCGCVRCTGHTPGCRKPEPSTTQNINLTIKLDAPILEHGFRVFNGLLRKILEGQQTMATTLADFQELGTKFDTDLAAVTTGVTDLKAQIQALKDQIATGGMNAADEAAAKELMASKEAQLAAAAALFAPTP
jgi:hypothetical protein